MKGRVDVWPSLTDLFSALLLGTFGALMLSVKPPPPPKRPCVDVVAEEVRGAIGDKLRGPLGGRIREGGDDVLIDVYLNFERDSDEIREEDRERLQQACGALRDLFGAQPQWKNYAEIWIEGHTDGTPPRQAATARDAVLYNWQLSSKRATSVLYEFLLCGVTPRTHRIRAIGYADTQPLPQCGQRVDCLENRRTTFRIRPDKQEIQKKEDFRGRTDCEAGRAVR